MRQNIISPVDVQGRVEWQGHSTSEELMRFRRRLVCVLVDRLNREHVTSVNERERVVVMAGIRSAYNPQGATHFMRIDRATGNVRGKYQKENIGRDGSSPNADVKAVLQALSAITGETFGSIDDLVSDAGDVEEEY